MKKSDFQYLIRMEKQLSFFEEKKISLGELIGDLLVLRDDLEEIDSDWEYAFTQQVASLESVNSYMIERNMTELDEKLSDILIGAFVELRKIIQKKTRETGHP